LCQIHPEAPQQGAVLRRGDRLGRLWSVIQVFLGESGNFGERLGVMHGHVGQHLTVQVDIRPFQTGDKATIGQPVQARRRIDPHDPKAAEVAFTCAAVSVGKIPTALNGFACFPIELTAGAPIALSVFQKAFVASP